MSYTLKSPVHSFGSYDRDEPLSAATRIVRFFDDRIFLVDSVEEIRCLVRSGVHRLSGFIRLHRD